MSASAWIALAFGASALCLNLIVIAVGYGVLKGTVAGLALRVSALEVEIGTLNELKVTVAEVKTTMGFLLEQFKDLNASVRWMREPAPPEPILPRRRKPPE